MDTAGIPTTVYYPVPLHQQAAVGSEQLSMPESERAAKQVLSIPMHPYLTEEIQVKIVDTIDQAIKVIKTAQ